MHGHPLRARGLPATRPKPPARRRRRARGAAVPDADLLDRLASVVEVLEAVLRGDLGARASVDGDDVAGVLAARLNEVIERDETLTRDLVRVGQVLEGAARGDLSLRVELGGDDHELRGQAHRTGATVNRLVEQLTAIASEVTRVAREVGGEGKLGSQVEMAGASGTWRSLKESVNMLAGNLTSQVRNVALVTTAVARGDLSQKITVDAQGEVLELKNTINTMVDQLRRFAAEVTRVAREVGTEGKLGGQAEVQGVSGTWKDLTDNVNQMARNLTGQVRGIVRVVTAVAEGDLSQKFVLESKGEIAAPKGEIAALADTINAMTETLRTFAEQVTAVAREVGIEGRLGGQAKVPGASGTWRDLVDAVNRLAGNLTTQVRAISNVATAVTTGDLTRTIDVEAQGEVLALKDTINQMIANLRDTTRSNEEQDWLKTNLAKFTAMMQGQRSLESLSQLLMNELTPAVSGQVGAFFVLDEGVHDVLRLLSSYAYVRRKTLASTFHVGEGLVGQAALEKKPILVTEVPEDYVQVASSLGEAAPRNIVVLPILFEGNVKGVIELGSFQAFSQVHLTFLEQLMLNVGVVCNMISASRRTEELLQELQRSNAELEARSSELEEKATLLEVKNREIAEASASLEEKARQLSLVSRYKSEFLTNMSHELRTPLNSMLILSNLLSENPEHNLSAKQIEYVRTIASAGSDLLQLISQILDLSKIEAGRLEVEKRPVSVHELKLYMERHFRAVAQQKGIAFTARIAPDVPDAIKTDSQRLEQILKNLLSNAFKFTEQGQVELSVSCERNTQRFSATALRDAPGALAFAVSDTGIGIPRDKQKIIFEAFQQGDASTSRTHGGTGLGLTISRELARLLGGEIGLRSEPGNGSTFTLYLPLERVVQPAAEPPPVPLPLRVAPFPAPAPTPAEAAAAPEPATGLAGKKVLVVDDDVRNVFAVTSLLERRGALPIAAGCAEEALAVLRQSLDVDAVLMDIMMPEVDGYEATRRIRALPQFARLPIVALTAKAMPGDREKCLEAGCDAFVAKPVEADALVHALERVLASPGGTP